MVNSSNKPERQRIPAALLGLAGIVIGLAATLVAGKNVPNPAFLLLALASLASMISPVVFALPGRWVDVTRGRRPLLRRAVACSLAGVAASTIIMLVFSANAHQDSARVWAAIAILAILPVGFLIAVAFSISRQKGSQVAGT